MKPARAQAFNIYLPRDRLEPLRTAPAGRFSAIKINGLDFRVCDCNSHRYRKGGCLMFLGLKERTTLTCICLAMLSYPQVKSGTLLDRAAAHTLHFDRHSSPHQYSLFILSC